LEGFHSCICRGLDLLDGGCGVSCDGHGEGVG
jgi:hypothetical protein